MDIFELAENEKEIGSWTTNYLPPDGGRYTGKLVVTDKRILFDAKFDTSLSGTLGELFIISGSHGYISIPKDKISSVEEKGGLLSKKVIIKLEDGKTHTINNGMLSVQKMAEAIEQK